MAVDILNLYTYGWKFRDPYSRPWNIYELFTGNNVNYNINNEIFSLLFFSFKTL